MKRLYDNVSIEHLNSHKQMLFLTGPRQVGKTTIANNIQGRYKNSAYLNWDNQDDRFLILSGPKKIANFLGIELIKEKKSLIIFDEIQKHKDWKNLIKGFFDSYSDYFHIIVTGSARLDIFQKGGDSLMGRYLPYFVHPISVGEILNQKPSEKEIQKPKKLKDETFNNLLNFGGFPDPFLKCNKRFYNSWKYTLQNQLVREDIRDLTKIQNLDKIEIVLEILRRRVGHLTNSHSLSKILRISDNSIRNWLSYLKNLYFCYSIPPFSKNIPRSLTKECKYYLYDWGLSYNEGSKFENFIASHLLKSISFWKNYGLGDYRLYFLRDKNKKEVDFLVTKENIPWMMVEAKTSNNKPISSSFFYFYEKLKPKHAFQVVLNMPYVNKNCFLEKTPKIVPAKTFLSQLI